MTRARLRRRLWVFWLTKVVCIEPLWVRRWCRSGLAYWHLRRHDGTILARGFW